MNYYAFHINDYSSATMHLSWDEDHAYRRLIDVYYMREAPLPADLKQIYRLVRATSSVQRKAIDTVLAEFFELTDDGYRNERCDEVIVEYKESEIGGEARKENEKERQKRHRDERKKLFATLRDLGVVPAFDTPTVTLRELVTSHDGHAVVTEPVTRDVRQTQRLPNPTTQYPIPNKEDGIGQAREPLADLEIKLRQAAGWENQPHPNLAVTGQIHALIESGADLELDVLPVVKSLAPRVRSPTGWKYFINPIAQARDDRIRAATVISPEGGNHERHRKPQRKGSNELLLEGVYGKDFQGDGEAR